MQRFDVSKKKKWVGEEWELERAMDEAFGI